MYGVESLALGRREGGSVQETCVTPQLKHKIIHMTYMSLPPSYCLQRITYKIMHSPVTPPHNIEDKMIILSNPRKSEWEIQRGEEREKKRVPCGKDLCLHPPHSLFSVMTPQSFFIEYWNLLNNKQARMVHDVTLSFLKKKKLEELERIYYVSRRLHWKTLGRLFLFYNLFIF